LGTGEINLNILAPGNAAEMFEIANAILVEHYPADRKFLG
jgi:hypothetical protein